MTESAGHLNRRAFLGGSAGVLGAAVCGRPSRAWPRLASRGAAPTPTPAQLRWQRAELGAVFHYDLHVFDGKRYSQGDNRRTPIDNPDIFAPDRLDMDQWVEAVRAMGGRFAILTASHETGFGLWQSDANPYCMKVLAWRDGKADLVAEFVEACRRGGIAPGIYMGVRWNSHLGVMDFRVTDRSPLTQAEYNRMVERQVEEICSRYGDLFELWFDGGILPPDQGGPDVLPIFEKHQPHCLFYHSDQRRDARWGGTESGTVPAECWATADQERLINRGWSAEFQNYLMHGDPDGADWCPAMSDAPLRGANGRHEWFWEPDDEGAIYSLDALMSMYERSVGHNSTLIMGLTPGPDGLVPEADMGRLAEWGREIDRRYLTPIASDWGLGRLYELELERSVSVDRVVLAEDIAMGQRIRAFSVEGRSGSGAWELLAEGQSVGNKRILPVVRRDVDAVRLRVTDDIAEPFVSMFAVFDTA